MAPLRECLPLLTFLFHLFVVIRYFIKGISLPTFTNFSNVDNWNWEQKIIDLVTFLVIKKSFINVKITKKQLTTSLYFV